MAGAAEEGLARSATRMGIFFDVPVTKAQDLYHLLCSSMGWSFASQLLSAFLHEKQMARSGVLACGSKNRPAAAMAAGLKFAEELKGHLWSNVLRRSASMCIVPDSASLEVMPGVHSIKIYLTATNSECRLWEIINTMKPNRLDDFRAWPAQKAIDMVVMESLISDLSSRCSLLPPPPPPPPPLCRCRCRCRRRRRRRSGLSRSISDDAIRRLGSQHFFLFL